MALIATAVTLADQAPFGLIAPSLTIGAAWAKQSAPRAGKQSQPLEINIRSKAGLTRVVRYVPQRAVKVRPGDRIKVLGTPMLSAQLERADRDLVITTVAGDVIVLAEFYADVSNNQSPPTLQLDRSPVKAAGVIKIVDTSGEVRLVTPKPGIPVQVTPGDQVTLLNWDPDSTQMQRHGPDMHILGASGGTFILKNLFAHET